MNIIYKICSFISILMFALLFFSSGCVSKAKHQELISNYEDLAQQKNSLEVSCDEDVEKLIDEISSYEVKEADLINQNQALSREKLEQAEAMNQMVSSLENKLAGEEARIIQLENSLKIDVLDMLMFESGSAAVTREGSRILAKIASTLISADDKDIIVVGHTDDLPPSENLARKYPSNWELSSARAASIVHILTWNYKISPTRMKIQGAAHYHPLTLFDPKDKSARKTNRVVEIILKNKDN